MNYLSLVFATLLFAGAFIAGKLGASSFSPVVMTFLRITLALVVLWPIMVYKEKKWKPSFYELKLSLALGFIGMTCYHLFFFTALRFTSASNASVINASMPIITALIAYFVLRERLNKWQILFMLTAFIGVLLTLTQWDLSILMNLSFNKGDIIMLLGTTSWALYGVLIKKYNHDTSALKLTTYSFLMCVIILSPFAIYEIIVHRALEVPLESYYTILYMALFPTVMGYTIQQHAIKTIGPNKAALFINLVPVFSIILSLIILKESINPLVYISGGLIVLSVIAFSQKKQKVFK